MEKLDPTASCIKCGSNYIQRELKRYKEGLVKDAIFSGILPENSNGEYLHSHCGGCHYEWDNLPLDSSPDNVCKVRK